MGIDALYQESIDTTLDDRQQRPVAAPQEQQGFGRTVWNTIKAPIVGAGAGGLEVAGFQADTIGAFGDVTAAYGAQADPTLLLSPEQMDQRVKDGEEARKRVSSGEAFSTDVGTGLRATARSMMPDPATSNAVENVLFQGGRGISKALGYGLTATPVVGAFLFGADEAATEADRLKAEGVDIQTRTKVGAVAGVAAGIGAALPVAGRTLTQTTALVVAGGPGGYIAQQAASREILKSQNYDRLGDQYNPFDPVGLAVSTLLPAGFAAIAGRGIRASANATPAPRSLIDMSGNERRALRYDAPELDDYAVQAANRAGIPPEVLLAVKNAGERSANSNVVSPAGAKGIMQFIDSTWKQYGKGKDPRDPIASIDAGADFLADLGRQYNGDWRAAIAHYNGGGRAAEEVRAGRAAPAAETRAYLERTDSYIATRSGEAAGRAAMGDPDAIHAAHTQLVRDTVDSWNLKDPEDIAGAQDHLAAIVRASDQIGAGQRVEVGDVIQWETLQQTRMLDDMIGRLESARADLLPEAGQAAEPGEIRQIRTELEQLRRDIPDNSDTAIRTRAKELQDEGAGRVSDKQAQGAARKEINAALAEHQGRIDALEQQIERNRGAEQSRQALDQLDQQIAGVQQQRAALDAPPSPVKQTALAAKQVARETPATKAPTAPKGEDIPPLNETPGGNTEAQAASAATKPTESATGAQSAAASIEAQADEIARLSPDMMVQLEGMDAPVRLADALDAVRAEAARDAADAPLLQAAAECFLRNS